MEATPKGHLLNERIENAIGRSFGNTSSSQFSDYSFYRERIWIDGRLKRRRCPKCRSRETQRSRRRGTFESVLMALLRLHPFRCRNCDWRFYGLYFELRSLRAQIPAFRGPQIRRGKTR
jgi:hypothetical protein